jgi:hypothetical protein
MGGNRLSFIGRDAGEVEIPSGRDHPVPQGLAQRRPLFNLRQQFFGGLPVSPGHFSGLRGKTQAASGFNGIHPQIVAEVFEPGNRVGVGNA